MYTFSLPDQFIFSIALDYLCKHFATKVRTLKANLLELM
jgi:hypothetical protein